MCGSSFTKRNNGEIDLLQKAALVTHNPQKGWGCSIGARVIPIPNGVFARVWNVARLSAIKAEKRNDLVPSGGHDVE